MNKPRAEVIFTHEAPKGALSRLAKANRARKIGPRLYTTNMVDAPAVILRRNVWKVLAGYFPDALIADRTALDLAPANDGSLFFITAHPHAVELPGLSLRPRRGTGPQAGDFAFRDGVMCSSTARAYLENMRPSRQRRYVSRTLPRRELEGRLERFVRNSGEEVFNRMRDDIRRLAPALELEQEAEQLSAIMGTLLGTKNEQLSNAAAVARAAGEAVDPQRLALFDKLHDALRRLPPLDEAADALAEGRRDGGGSSKRGGADQEVAAAQCRRIGSEHGRPRTREQTRAPRLPPGRG